MDMNQAIEILEKHAPLKRVSLRGEPIIGCKDGWPFSLESRDEMDALMTVVNSATSGEWRALALVHEGNKRGNERAQVYFSSGESMIKNTWGAPYINAAMDEIEALRARVAELSQQEDA